MHKKKFSKLYERSEDKTHIMGCAGQATTTLCGGTGREERDYIKTKKEINCKACLAIYEYIKSHSI